MQTNKAAEARRRAQERDRARAGSGRGRSSDRDVERGPNIEIDGIKLFHPRGFPWKRKDGNMYVEGAKFFQQDPKSRWHAILGDPWTVNAITVHRIQTSVNPAVLPMAWQRKDKNPLMTNYVCTFGASEKFEDFSSWTPHEDWMPNEEGDELILRHPNDPDELFLVRVRDEGNVVRVCPPITHPFVDPRVYVAEERFASIEEAMFRAERLQSEALSCPFCAQTGRDFYDGVHRDEKPVQERTKELYLIPVFNLSWVYAEKPKEERSSNGRARDLWSSPFGSEPSTEQPRPSDKHGHVLGWGWLEVSPWSDTWKNYSSAAWSAFCTCKSCLGKDGDRTSRSAHVISVSRMKCPQCDSTLKLQKLDEKGNPERVVELSEREILNWPETADPKRVDGLDDPSTAGLFQLINLVPCACEECGYFGLFEPELECSSCADPQPMLLSDMIHVISRSEKKHEKDSTTYSFEPRVGEKDYRVRWIDRFDALPATTDGKITVKDLVEPGIDAAKEGTFDRFMPIHENNQYPRLSFGDGQSLIGVSLLDLRRDHGVRR